jgi:hypothetical protein
VSAPELEPFFVVQLFHKPHPTSPASYYTSIFAADLVELRAKVAARSAVKGMAACSLPFAGTWSEGLPGRLMRDATMPADFKRELAFVDRTVEE